MVVLVLRKRRKRTGGGGGTDPHTLLPIICRSLQGG